MKTNTTTGDRVILYFVTLSNCKMEDARTSEVGGPLTLKFRNDAKFFVSHRLDGVANVYWTVHHCNS